MLFPVRRTVTWFAALAVALCLASTPVGVATAGPTRAAMAYAPDATGEGGSRTLREQLDAASKGYLDAKASLKHSEQRQKQLAARLATVESDLAARRNTIGKLADGAYRAVRLGPVAALLNSDSRAGLLDRAATLGAVAAHEDRLVRQLADARAQQTVAKTAIDKEIREQRKQVAVMAKRKQQAERALLAAGSGGATNGITGAGSALATPAPRNADGSWPPESCSVDDPTTSGCITPRALHALNEAKKAGFTHYIACYRDSSWGEHPKGRACDFAAARDGFGGVATGAERTYGNNLAGYFIHNADRLAVLYVIWYKRIWLPSSGWKTYNGGNGDPASDHTNHVHLSVY